MRCGFYGLKSFNGARTAVLVAFDLLEACRLRLEESFGSSSARHIRAANSSAIASKAANTRAGVLVDGDAREDAARGGPLSERKMAKIATIVEMTAMRRVRLGLLFDADNLHPEAMTTVEAPAANV